MYAKRRRKQFFWCWLFVLPTTLFYAAFQAWPILSSIYYSTLDWSGISSKKNFVGLANFAELFKDNERMKSMNSDGFIYIKSEYKLIRIDYYDILYVEGVKDYIKLYFTAGKKPVMSLMNMKKMEDYLPKPQFLRVHRSFIVNMAKVEMIDRGRIVIGESFIPISESYKEIVQDYIDNHTLQ